MSDQPPPKPKRLPTYAGLRLRHDTAYRELIGMLADSTQRVDEGANALAESAYCIRAVMTFVSCDAVAAAAVLPGPLNMLQAALHDLEQGANPALFSKHSSKGSRPTNIISRDIVKAYVAAAFDKLLQAKVKKDEAASWVVQECERLGIWQSEGSITSKRVMRWNKELASEQIAAGDAIETYKRLRKANTLILNPWARSRVTLETYARSLMEPKRRDTPPFSDNEPTASS